jgi:hypothetical protein
MSVEGFLVVAWAKGRFGAHRFGNPAVSERQSAFQRALGC